jgi:hypothetical protein
MVLRSLPRQHRLYPSGVYQWQKGRGRETWAGLSVHRSSYITKPRCFEKTAGRADSVCNRQSVEQRSAMMVWQSSLCGQTRAEIRTTTVNKLQFKGTWNESVPKSTEEAFK